MSKDNSGSAFPVQINDYDIGAPGMTLRDYFAGQALAGFASRMEPFVEPYEHADDAYAWADAMLEARK